MRIFGILKIAAKYLFALGLQKSEFKKNLNLVENIWKDIDSYIKYPYDQNNCAFLKEVLNAYNMLGITQNEAMT